MLNLTELQIDAFVARLRDGYHRTYGAHDSEHAEIIGWAGAMALENIANSNALYHNVEHTILVTLVGQEILRGKHIREGGVSTREWQHFVISLLCHDIGYVHGVCLADGDGKAATGRGDELVSMPEGATDAWLTPYHVDRGKLFIRERFGDRPLIDADTIARNVEHTRFPVPEQQDSGDMRSFPGLVRAADLIGQLGDPRYLKKIPALFYEFQETGVNAELGYRHPGDLRTNYPRFYWERVHPYVADALDYLSRTQQGQQITASLFANVLTVQLEVGSAGQ